MSIRPEKFKKAQIQSLWAICSCTGAFPCIFTVMYSIELPYHSLFACPSPEFPSPLQQLLYSLRETSRTVLPARLYLG